MEFASENCRYHCSRDHSGVRNADNYLWVVGARYFEGQSARHLAEERPFDFEHALGSIDGTFAR